MQEKEIERVGDSRKRHVDIRIIAATNEDLYGLVRSGHFRQDLYYRLRVFPIEIPSLRKRKEDIPLLVTHFIRDQNIKTGKNITGVTESALRIIMDYAGSETYRMRSNGTMPSLCSAATMVSPALASSSPDKATTLPAAT